MELYKLYGISESLSSSFHAYSTKIADGRLSSRDPPPPVYMRPIQPKVFARPRLLTARYPIAVRKYIPPAHPVSSSTPARLLSNHLARLVRYCSHCRHERCEAMARCPHPCPRKCLTLNLPNPSGGGACLKSGRSGSISPSY